MKKHEAELRQFLFTIVETAIASGDDAIKPECQKNFKRVNALRSLGYIDPQNRILDKAYLELFEEFPECVCPPEIKKCVGRFGIPPVSWRRITARATKALRLRKEDNAKAFPFLNTIFIRDDARPQTWFHEIAHLLFSRVTDDQIARLRTVSEPFVFLHDGGPIRGLPDVRNGRYLDLAEGFYCLEGLGPNSLEDEVWAHSFALHSVGLEVPIELRRVVIEISNSLVKKAE